VIGIDDAVVVATGDAVLVTSVAEAQLVSAVVDEQEPEGRGEAVANRRVDRSWSSCWRSTAIDPDQSSGPSVALSGPCMAEDRDIVFRGCGLTKVYGSGPLAVHALRAHGVIHDFDGRAGAGGCMATAGAKDAADQMARSAPAAALAAESSPASM
jgi:hypothetical protein